MHKAFRPFAPMLGLLLSLPLPSHAQSVLDPGYRYYEVGDLDAAPAAHTEPAMMLMGGGEWVPEAFSGGCSAPGTGAW